MVVPWLAALLPTLRDIYRELKGLEKAAWLGSSLPEPDGRETVSGNRL